MHHVSDVIAGIILGIFIGLFFYKAQYQRIFGNYKKESGDELNPFVEL